VLGSIALIIRRHGLLDIATSGLDISTVNENLFFLKGVPSYFRYSTCDAGKLRNFLIHDDAVSTRPRRLARVAAEAYVYRK